MICALASLVTDRTLRIPWLLMVLRCFFYKLGFCGSHRLAGTVISLACVHIMFTVLIKKTTTTEDSFLYRASNAVQNIISCFANDHRNCRIYSLVCNAHLQTYSTKHTVSIFMFFNYAFVFTVLF
jgi:hypothetical protein